MGSTVLCLQLATTAITGPYGHWLGTVGWGLLKKETCRIQAATMVMVRKVIVPELLVTLLESEYYVACGSTSLGFFCAGTRQVSDQSHAIGRLRKDITPVLKANTPNSFIHLLYNSLCVDKVNMHNIVSTPSVSVLVEKTMEAS